MTKFKAGPRAPLAVAVAALLLALAATMTTATEASRTKRQAQSARPTGGQRPAPMDASTAFGIGASAVSVAGIMPLPTAGGEPGAAENRPLASAMNRPARPKARPQQEAVPQADPDAGFDQAVDEEPEMAPKRRRPPMRHKSPAGPRAHRHGQRDDGERGDYSEAEEDCDYNEYDYGNMFHAAFRPMRQLGDMMGNMFEHMQGLGSGGK